MEIWIALIVAILSIVLVTMLRAVLGVRLDTAPGVAVQRTGAPPAWADLYEPQAQRLQALGWQGPVWVASEQGPPQGVTHLYAVFRSPDGRSVILLAAPLRLDRPHLLRMHTLSTWKQGERILSVAGDPAQIILATSELHYVQSLATDVDGVLADHAQAFAACERACGPADVMPELDAAGPGRTGAQPFLEAMAALDQRHFASLLKYGRAVRRGTRLFASWSFAWRLLASAFSAKLPPADLRPIPPARMTHLAAIQDAVMNAPPPADRQWLLFAVSVVLFMGAGGVVFGWEFAWQLLVVILIHELGHYLTMRACGYRNLQMLALPLVGGVAMGREVQPDPVHRAWIALMGPLPGVLIGIGLWLGGDALGLPEWLTDSAWVFLLVNLINLAPFPPLDGSHVVRALAGRRALAAAAWVTLLGGAVGMGLAGWLGYTVFAVLIGLQLLAVPGLFKQAELACTLASQSALPARHLAEQVQLREVLTALERVEGPALTLEPRLGQARAVVEQHRMRVTPRRTRLGLGLLYGALLVGPVVWVLLPIWQLGQRLEERTGQQMAQMQERYLRMNEDRLDLRQAARALSTSALWSELDTTPRAPATSTQVSAAEQQLGRVLTPELQAFYLERNGGTELELQALESLGWLADISGFSHLGLDSEYHETGELSPGATPDGPLSFHAIDTEVPLRVMPAELARMLPLGRGAIELRYDLGATPQHAGVRIYSAEGAAYPDLRALGETHWVETQLSRRMLAQQRAEWDQREQALAQVPVQEVLRRLVELEHMPLPAGLPADVRRLMEVQVLPGASEVQIMQTGQRLGYALPEDLAAVMRLQDGGAAQLILPLARWQMIGAEAEWFAGELQCPTAASDCPTAPVTAEHYSSCVSIGGDPRREESFALLLWCPHLQATPYVDRKRKVHPSLESYLRHRLALLEMRG